MPLKYAVDEYSIEDYLNSETQSTVKCELIEGGIYAMAGASTNHNRLVNNISSEFRSALKKTPCEAFSSDMKMRVGDNFFYPDALVVCDHQGNDNGITETPLIVIEVLSRSTRQIDHTLKRRAYQKLPSLMEYVIIEQDLVDVDVCRRRNHWQSEHYYLSDEIFFTAIGFYLSVIEIYDRVVNKDMQNTLLNLE